MSDEGEATFTRPESETYDDVIVSTLRLQARQGSLPALLYRPKFKDSCPAVVLAAEAYGINTFARRVAATLAHLGYVTLVPDYYRGVGPTDPEGYLDFTEVLAFIDDLDFRQAAHDVIAAIEYLQADPGVRPDRVAVWGYCTGATLAMLAAALRPELAAAVLFFPGTVRRCGSAAESRPPRRPPVECRVSAPLDLRRPGSCPVTRAAVGPRAAARRMGDCAHDHDLPRGRARL
jgi:dienelactone hydrolase